MLSGVGGISKCLDIDKSFFRALSACAESRRDLVAPRSAGGKHAECVPADEEIARRTSAAALPLHTVGGLDHFHPDCACRKWSSSLFDRMIPPQGTFRSAAIAHLG